MIKINRTIKCFVAGIAFMVALLSTTKEAYAWKKDELIVENKFTINANAKIKEGLDVVFKNSKC